MKRSGNIFITYDAAILVLSDIQERLDGKTADWMEQVSDEQYQA